MVYKMTVENDCFCKNQKLKNGCFWPFLGYFWLCFSHPTSTNLMKLHTKDHIRVYKDCTKFRTNRMDSF